MPSSTSDINDTNDTITINVNPKQVTQFDHRMTRLFYSSRPTHAECLLRCQILSFFNSMWQKYLIEQEQNAMVDPDNEHYQHLGLDLRHVVVEEHEIATHPMKPYRKRQRRDGVDDEHASNCSGNERKSDTSTDHASQDKSETSGSNVSDSNNSSDLWCTPLSGNDKLLIIKNGRTGTTLHQVRIPCVKIFGSIAFGLDGVGSDIDLAIPASVRNSQVDSHSDHDFQVSLLCAFERRLKFACAQSTKLKTPFRWHVERILHARVPILKLTEVGVTKGALSVDIGIQSTQMPTARLLRYYVSYDERASIFYTFIKRWSRARRINDAMYGYPNSFGYVMLVTKFLQLLHEPLIPVVVYDSAADNVIKRHSIEKFRRNRMTLLELAVAFFDFYHDFDFVSYQIDITTCGLQWKHGSDYNICHADQESMLIQDPSVANENVTRCLKPYNLRIMQAEMFRAYKCAVNADWNLLFEERDEERGNLHEIFQIYPPVNEYEQSLFSECIQSDDEHDLW
eukprot:CAMPEP_0202694514 /NCGR_PEP_ID=MMETSP1385-20130828/8358_1 /ASSEMBLY_ACC=CAM_ASM_000861 /TAXON_ID=933848 /ORGANISM="Elphidium margaritaceum" /LENGTH=509 /DNA_ID=CAMNT_0049350377 /DNA_START=52 /DNA_END=1578 /DNA_ORIENTATION=+